MRTATTRRSDGRAQDWAWALRFHGPTTLKSSRYMAPLSPGSYIYLLAPGTPMHEMPCALPRHHVFRFRSPPTRRRHGASASGATAHPSPPHEPTPHPSHRHAMATYARTRRRPHRASGHAHMHTRHSVCVFGIADRGLCRARPPPLPPLLSVSLPPRPPCSCSPQIFLVTSS